MRCAPPLVVLVLAFACAFPTRTVRADDAPVAEVVEGATPTEAPTPAAVSGAVPGIAALLERSTVSIVEHRPRRRSDVDRYGIMGTGFFVSADAHILTANHVLKQAIGDTRPEAGRQSADLRRLAIGWMHDESSTTATMLTNLRGGKLQIVARDTARDLVLLKAETDPVPAVRFADVDVPTGFEVGFTGFPFGASLGFRPLLNRGSISGRRLLPGLGKKADPFLGYILDASVHGGHSGSAVFDIRTGVVVAMVLRRRAETIPFAIGSREIVSFLREAGVEPLLADSPAAVE